MVLWIVLAALAALASLLILVPLYRTARPERASSAAALSVYRDQLSEIDRDLNRGIIAESEATAARTEIARRLLRADDQGQDSRPDSRSRLIAAAAIIAMPVAALGFYLVIGSPELPDRPLTARLTGPLEGQDIVAVVARFEGHLSRNAQDGRAWDLIAPIYVRLGRYEDGVTAYTKAISLLGSTADREANLGDAILRSTDGTVTPPARAAFERANKLDPTALRPRFFLAVALGQEGKREEAIAAWRALLAGAPDDAPWVPIAQGALAELEKPADAGPTAADVEAASQMSEGDRAAMISGMVESLAAKLEADPDDADGWARLIRSYMVLGREEDARAAVDRARSALAEDTAKLAIVDQAARELKLVH